MRQTFVVVAALCLGTIAGCAGDEAQNAAGREEPPAPYKLGMFSGEGRTFVGMIVGDTLVVDLSRAGVNAPSTLKELIARVGPGDGGSPRSARRRGQPSGAGLRVSAVRPPHAAAHQRP